VPTIFLESHNIKNLHFGFGQFNYHLIKGLYNANVSDFKITLHAKDLKSLQSEFGSYFNYKKYYSFRRHPLFQIKKKYDLWHSLNQNIKIEPYHKIPYLLTVHNITYIKDKENYKDKEEHIKFQNKLYRSDAITYISEYAKQSTHQFFDVPKVPEYIIYNGNPIRNIILTKNHKPQLTLGNPFLFSIGEFTDRKNFGSLIEMLTHLKDFNLIIAGKNNTQNAEKVKTLITKHSLQNRVMLTGKISETDKQYYLQNCIGFVFPSLREGFGLPVIEAMKFGKPVFISNNTSLPEIGGEHAFYWNHFDAKYMANIIIDGLDKYLNNQEFYKDSYIKRANSFNWDKAAKEYIKVYNKTINIF
jgi:glycosyltransferase involved in cell wall biosynthesis